MAAHFAQAVRPGMTVVDAGAYLGYFTLIAAGIVGRKGHVYAFEPHPESFEALLGNVRANRFEDRVTAVRMALADRPGIRPFGLDDNPTHSGFAKADDRSRSMEVQCLRLDDYFDHAPPPDMVKIDVEGAELAVLTGMQQTLDRVRDDFVMIVEFNPAALRQAGTGPDELVAWVREAGLRIWVINERSGRIESPNAANLFQRSWVNLWASR